VIARRVVHGQARAQFERCADQPLAERLVRAMEAGEAAGGEGKPVISAALVVMEKEIFPLVDLRVDLAPDAITALRTLWDAYAPSVREFVTRAVDPDAAPSVI
jgi:uncharacterized Ntn-hydrolase superfamily protein